MAKTRTRTPPRAEYARRLAEALALRRALGLIDGLLRAPPEALGRLWGPGTTTGTGSDPAWMPGDLQGLRYNMSHGLDQLEGNAPRDVRDLAARLRVGLAEEGGRPEPDLQVDAEAGGRA